MDSLERRREINRRAARRSRSRRKEAAASIRKKYFEAQSTNTQLVYERNKLKRERNLLRSLLEAHRCELLVQPGPSAPLEQRWQPREEEEDDVSFDLSPSDIEEETCPSLQSAGDLLDKENFDAEIDIAFSSCSEDETSSSVGELSPSSEQISSPVFTEQEINDGISLGLILESNCDVDVLRSSDFSQNLDCSSYPTPRCDDDFSSILDFKSNGLSSIFDELIDFSTNSEDLVTTSTESRTSPFDLLRSEWVPADIQGIEAETLSELCPETDQQQQSEALDLSKHGPLSRIRRSWSQCRQSPSSVVVEKENFFTTETSSSLKTKRSLSTVEPRVSEQNGKDFAGNIPLLVESFVVGEKY